MEIRTTVTRNVQMERIVESVITPIVLTVLMDLEKTNGDAKIVKDQMETGKDAVIATSTLKDSSRIALAAYPPSISRRTALPNLDTAVWTTLE